MSERQGIALAFFLCALLCRLGAAEDYPVITRLDQQDEGFRQYIQDVQDARRRLFNRERSGETLEEIVSSLTIYRYRPAANEDLFSLASRCNIPYAALATLNRINSPALFGSTSPLLLPSVPGIFAPEKPDSDLERLIASGRSGGIGLNIRTRGKSEAYRFYPGEDYSGTERIFFLNPLFRFPLREYRLSSAFGMRINPVTGRTGVHKGLDLAAPQGSPVYAAGDGVVTELGEDPIYGKYVIIKHGENWASLYGHLSKIGTDLRRQLRSGTLIGEVGSTGQSTGPHLHFELRRNGRAEDPGRLLFRGGEAAGQAGTIP